MAYSDASLMRVNKAAGGPDYLDNGQERFGALHLATGNSVAPVSGLATADHPANSKAILVFYDDTAPKNLVSRGLRDVLAQLQRGKIIV